MMIKNKSIDTHGAKLCIFTKLNKVPFSIRLGNQRMGLRDKQDSGGNYASDTKAVTPGTVLQLIECKE